MYLVDTHCHIHDAEFAFDIEKVIAEAKTAGVRQLITVGTTAEDSLRAAELARQTKGVWASAGLHPHDAKLGEDDLEVLARLSLREEIVAIGECGLDYYYDNSPRQAQKSALEYQLQIALQAAKPCIFHVREAFDDFWPIVDNFSGVKGVVHSFTGSVKDMEEVLKRGFYIGLNGIMTFTKDPEHSVVVKTVHEDRLLLETDAPFLTPHPLRGKMNVPAHVRLVAVYLAELRGQALESLVQTTTANAHRLFSLTGDKL